MKLKVQNTTVKTNESWADSWKYRVLVQIECRSADCSTPQDQRRRMPGCQDEVWCEGRWGLHEQQSGERREWKLMRLVHISPVCNLVPYHSAPCRLINIVWTWCALSPAASVVMGKLAGMWTILARKMVCRVGDMPVTSRVVWCRFVVMRSVNNAIKHDKPTHTRTMLR